MENCSVGFKDHELRKEKEADEAKRQILAHLIAEEKAKLDALFPCAFT
jgi:hypothetical protein